MAKAVHLAKIRDALAPRGEPYWGAPLAGGVYLGYRKHANGKGTWVARWRDETSRQRYETLGKASPRFDHGAAQAAAQAWLKRLESDVEDSAVSTVEDACKAYVADLRQEGRMRTAQDAENNFKRRLYGTPLGTTKLGKLQTAHIKEWRASTTAVLRGAAVKLSPASQNRLLTSLKAALNFAVASRFVSKDKAIEWDSVSPLEGTGKRDLFLNLTQRRALLAELSGGARDLAEAVMLTGARAGELTSATRGAFDAMTGTVKLSGKTGPRTVKLPPAASALFLRLSRGKLPAAALFTRDDGMPWKRCGDWASLINAAAARAGLPVGTCLYTLRHSFIAESLSAGLTAYEVAKFTGTSIPMIEKYYGKYLPETTSSRLAAVNFT